MFVFLSPDVLHLEHNCTTGEIEAQTSAVSWASVKVLRVDSVLVQVVQNYRRRVLLA